jgi:translation initiation factor 2B subunit (eIF-2B alpha/beta/delta family)
MTEGTPLPRHWLLRALQLERAEASTASVEALGALIDAVEESWLPGADPVEASSRLRAYIERLRAAQPRAAALQSNLARCAAGLESGKEEILAEARRILEETEQAGERLLQAASALLRPGARVLTYGGAPTVLKFLSCYGDRLERVTVCEARPTGEGLLLATELGRLALPVRLITESHLELAVPECDLCLVACDRVLPDGSVVAPVGTAVAARWYGGGCAGVRGPSGAVLRDRGADELGA